jgi:hypothetical protein
VYASKSSISCYVALPRDVHSAEIHLVILSASLEQLNAACCCTAAALLLLVHLLASFFQRYVRWAIAQHCAIYVQSTGIKRTAAKANHQCQSHVVLLHYRIAHCAYISVFGFKM